MSRLCITSSSFTIVPDQASAHGEIKIAAKLVKPTRVVWLNARSLKVEKATLAGTAARIIAGGEDFVGLVADHDLPATFDIDVVYTAAIDHDKSRGICTTAEGDKSFVYTFFESLDARRHSRASTSPRSRSLAAHVPRQGAISSRRQHGDRQGDRRGTDMKRVELAETAPLPSYLVAFVGRPLRRCRRRRRRPRARRHFIVPRAMAKSSVGEAGHAEGRRCARGLLRHGLSVRQARVAVVPRYWGTMEHPGIVAMGQTLTLIRPGEQTREREEKFLTILSHEMATTGSATSSRWRGSTTRG